MVNAANPATVVLVGCGNIGFRHLQALTGMETPSTITVVEPAEAAHPRILALIAEEDAKGRHKVQLLSGLDQDGIPGETGLAIIATDTSHRREAWEALRARTKVRNVIFEKVLFPTLGDIDAVGAQLAADGAAGYVNCTRRGFQDYHRLRARFEGTPLDVAFSGTSYGMASNMIHFLDIAEFLNASGLVSVDVSGLVPGSVPSKRGHYVEVFGTITGTLANGATVSAVCDDAEGLRVAVRLTGHDGAVLDIDERSSTVSEAGETSPFEVRLVSGMSDIYEEILTGKAGKLTPYADATRQHRLFLTAMRGHLGLSNAKDEPCPIS